MRILLVNKNFFLSGGPDRYMFSFKKLFESKGHEVIPLSIRQPMNIETPYEKYFISSPCDLPTSGIASAKLTWKDKVRLLLRSIYSIEAKNKIIEVINNEKVDLVLFLAIYNYISPSVIDGAKRMGKPTVMSILDFNMLCPNARYIYREQICEDCKQGLYKAIFKKCVQNSAMATLGRVFSMWLHNLTGIYKKIDAFIVPSNFMREKLIEGGYDGRKIFHIPFFVDVNELQPHYEHEKYILYFGKVSIHKGIRFLINAFEGINEEIKLFIVGDSYHDERERFMSYVEKQNIKNIRFIPFLPDDELYSLIRRSMFVVVPSICQDNSPLTVYESFCFGKPVVASNIGGIKEQIKDGRTGFLVTPGNTVELREKIKFLIDNPSLVTEMGKNAREMVGEQQSGELQYLKLMEIFNSLTGKHI